MMKRPLRQRLRQHFAVPLIACAAGLAFSAAHAADPPPLPTSQCSMFAMWAVSAKVPNGASPFSGYLMFKLQSDANGTGRNVNDVALVIEQDFPAAPYGGWFIYPTTYEMPTGGVTFNNVVPDPGSVNPFQVGNPVFAPNRHMRLVMTSNAIARKDLPANIRAMLPEKGAGPNHITWPNRDPDGFTVMNRTYAQYDGYTRGGFGGPLNIDWPKITAYDVHTGVPIPCADVQVARDVMQRLTPWNTVGYAGLDRVPLAIRGLFPARANRDFATSAPKPNPLLVEFFRTPSFWTGLPGGVVPNPKQDNPDLCGNYMNAILDQRKIAIIRQPLVPEYAPPDRPADAVVPASQQLGAINLQVGGRLQMNYLPGEPGTYAIGNAEIKKDRDGRGATVLVWPTTLNRFQEKAVIDYANARGWTLLAGNLKTRTNYLMSIILRQNGPVSNYYGASYPTYDSEGKLIRTGVGCYLGPQSPALDQLGLTAQPDSDFNQIGSEWAMNFKTSGPYALQGVQCTNVAELLNGQCLNRLKVHMRYTGNDYDYTGPVPWVPDYAKK